MSKFIFTILLMAFWFSYPLFAQNGSVEVYYEKNSRNEYQFFAKSTTSTDFHVVVNFSKMNGVRCDCGSDYSKNVSSKITRLFKLVPTGVQVGGDFSFGWTYHPGHANPQHKKRLVYLLPTGENTETTVLGVKNLTELYGNKEPSESFYSLGFTMPSGSLVYASRGGYVQSVVDGKESDLEDLSFSSERNSITIKHRDNTLSTYSVLKNNSIRVKKGDYVKAGDPLAVVGGDNYASGPHVRLTVYALSYEPGFKIEYGWKYYQPLFATAGNTKMKLADGQKYTSDYSFDLLTQELSKKEIRGFKKK